MIHLLKLLSFLNQNLEVLLEVDGILVLTSLDQNLLLQEDHRAVHNICRPLGILLLLVFVYFLHQFQILTFHVFICSFVELLLVFVELYDRTFHSLYQAFRPTNYSSDWRLPPTNY